MMKKAQVNSILDKLEMLIPDAACELNYDTLFQLLISVVLSAQTTDKRVNIVTIDLFKKYPDIDSLANANYFEVLQCIKSVGLAKTKANNIIKLAQDLQFKFNYQIPANIDELMLLPGVGRKTASVMLVEGFKIPAMPVDTHVERVAKRLKFAQVGDSVLKVENKLKKAIEKERWLKSHHLFIHFGRYHCLAKKPHCEYCSFTKICRFYKKMQDN